ncbi:YheC/YheD family protein [Cohnella silvisoli]|uniref:YheC/YheD family protein n=1 Tax=Cohnella silvisoli TaxID=2873699 RepID=A0ABV1KTS4_9BACL|nr:YheC/YheD family protein [Cohnella silvisoli]MCD9022774.1 YheC/YheD family protein [Cohnella silvisoli]
MSQYVGSKWRKTVALLRRKSLRSIIPRTVAFNRPQLLMMLKEFKMVYVKPDTGAQGKGVMRVEKSDGHYRFQLGKRVRFYLSYNPMYEAIRKETKGRKYLVQRGVHLLKYKGRRFDLRVMVQLNPRKVWETTGIIGRVAAPRKIVTNYHDGGTPMAVSRLLGSHINKRALRRTVRSLESIGVTAGLAMRKKFRRVYEIGVDVGMDRSMTPWILEVNTAPDPFIFRKLPDPSVFRKIRRYAKVYGKW